MDRRLIQFVRKNERFQLSYSKMLISSYEGDGRTIGIIRNTNLDSGFTTFIFSSCILKLQQKLNGREKKLRREGIWVRSQVGLTPKFVERHEIRSSIIPPTAIVSILFFFLQLISRDELITGEKSNGGNRWLVSRYIVDTIRQPLRGERQERRFRGWLNFRGGIEGSRRRSDLSISWRKYRYYSDVIDTRSDYEIFKFNELLHLDTWNISF